MDILGASFVFAGGALGAALRAKLAEKFDGEFPRGTFAANMLASFALGMIAARTGDFSADELMFLRAGFCASLSTFSSISCQLASMLRKRRTAAFFAYILSTAICGMFAFVLGKIL